MGQKRKTPDSAYAKDRLLHADLTDLGEMLDVYRIPEDVKRDPEVLNAIKEAIRTARERIQDWQALGDQIDPDELNLPARLEAEFGIKDRD